MGQTFSHFSDAAQRLGVYTTYDYIEIMESLLKDWKIDGIQNLNDAGEKARDYLMALPSRLRRVAERTKIPNIEYQFSWIS
jgi:acyl-[acyl-carrier-protein] desaturase